MRYDLIVIGSGPAGQKGAIAAAKLGKRVALVERNHDTLGGVCLHTGTVPSKTMREAILHLTGFRQRDVYRATYLNKRQITMDDLRRKLDQVTREELAVIYDQLDRNGIDVLSGEASFVGPHEIQVTSTSGRSVYQTDNVLIATGTKPSRPAHIPFDGQCIFDSDEILSLDRIPRSMIVVGGGVIGIEYAIMFATLGVKVTVVDGRERLLDFCDYEIIDALLFHARSLGVTFRLGESVAAIDVPGGASVSVALASGKHIVAETVLFGIGRVGDSDALNLRAAGLGPDKRGRIKGDESHRTAVENIYAVGDIIGFPALASTSMEQGRRAICHMFDEPFHPCPHVPYGLFTIPEISMVGKTEQQLTRESVPYEVGISRFCEIARGRIAGDEVGMLKVLFDRESLEILGVHCIGESATEIVHIGQAVMALNGTIEYFRDNVFNYPSISGSYKVAAFDGLNRIGYGRSETADVDSGVKEPSSNFLLHSLVH